MVIIAIVAGSMDGILFFLARGVVHGKGGRVFFFFFFFFFLYDVDYGDGDGGGLMASCFLSFFLSEMDGCIRSVISYIE